MHARRAASSETASQTTGLRDLLERHEFMPAACKDAAVTAPAGWTIDGILGLEEGQLCAALNQAVVKATQRAKGADAPELVARQAGVSGPARGSITRR
jgi:pyrroline-5-carboxylate reductase